MSIEIDDLMYKFEDEELDEIEYLEIMSLDDIIKDNPSFIALSRNDIQENLYNMFLNKKKAENVVKLFYEIIDDNNKKRGILNNYDNYIFNVEAEKKENDLLLNKDPSDANYFNKLEKREINDYNKAKNKYFFCLKYNNESKNIRFNNDKKIVVSLEPYQNKEYPIYYPVFPIDEVNIPIISAYYKIPKTTINDNLYEHITSFLINNKNINLKLAHDYDSVRELIKDVQPDINHIIKYLNEKEGDNFTLNYNNINSIFKKFGKSLDLINETDYDILYNYMISITEYEKERKNVSRPVKIKKSDISNKKLIFFDKLKSILNLLDLKDNTITFLEKTKKILEEHLSNVIVTDEIKNLNSLNIYDLILHIDNIENEEIEQILSNIKQYIHLKNIRETIDEIDKILNTHNDKEVIFNNYELLKKKVEYSRNHITNYDKDGKQYLISYREVKEIKEGRDNENYEGIPNDYSEENLDIEDQDNLANEIYDIKYTIDSIDINKYLTNINYKTEEGFIDGLKIILPELYEISKMSNIELDYDILCSELFKYNRSIPSRRYIYMNEFRERNIEFDNTLLKILEKVSPKHISNINGLVSELDKDTIELIIFINDKWLKMIRSMFINAISFWIINVQEKILEDTFPLDENYLNDNYIVNWYKYGSPFNNLKKSEDKGVLPYILNIAKEYLSNNNEFSINIDNLLKDTIKYIEENYITHLENMKDKYEIFKNRKKEMRGLIEQDKFKSLRDNKVCVKSPNLCKEQHVKSLIYMPDINYVKLHKFLHGCCLKKLDDTFSDDIDIRNAKRKDLIAWKKEFSKKRLTNKGRDQRFIPLLVDKIVVEKEIYSTIKEDITYNIKSYTVSSWLNDMRIKNNTILKAKSIDDIELNAKKIDNEIKNNLNILAKTSKNIKNENFISGFYKNKIKYKSIIFAIIKILNSFSKKKDDLEITLLIDISIKDLKNIIIDLNNLNSLITDEYEVDIERINKYIVSRALCCPFNPDELINGCLSSTIINNSIVQELMKIIYTEILKIIQLSFPTAEENVNFLNEQREKNKQNKINILNDKSVEENLLIKELKKAGIKYKLFGEIAEDENAKLDEFINDVDNIDTNTRKDKELFDNIYDVHDGKDEGGERGERGEDNDDEHKLDCYDNDSDDDNMVYEDMGFIYN
jgi:hypothetical protein